MNSNLLTSSFSMNSLIKGYQYLRELTGRALLDCCKHSNTWLHRIYETTISFNIVYPNLALRNVTCEI